MPSTLIADDREKIIEIITPLLPDGTDVKQLLISIIFLTKRVDTWPKELIIAHKEVTKVVSLAEQRHPEMVMKIKAWGKKRPGTLLAHLLIQATRSGSGSGGSFSARLVTPLQRR